MDLGMTHHIDCATSCGMWSKMSTGAAKNEHRSCTK